MNERLPFPSPDLQQRVRTYIHETWETLTRDHGHLLLAIEDTKVDHQDGKRDLRVYISPRENFEEVASRLKASLGPMDFKRVDLRVLPPEPDMITDHGLLYLPGRYVVPGGRFNEFYGWDGYFIQRGLLRSGRKDLAKSLVDQALYEVDHYGTVLNANRTYYLSRSHPPVLSMMVKAQFAVSQDLDWLLAAIPLIEKFYYFWRVPPHLNQSTGLSRYYDLGDGPAPEVEFSEKDSEGRTHYERVRDFLRTAEVHSYDKNLYYDEESDSLTALAYVGDRSMRESGFDPTDRFGVLNLDVIHYAPVCLNVLIYQMEKDLGELCEITGDLHAQSVWIHRSQVSADLIQSYFWNDEEGLYFDYHLRQERQRSYPFLTTFWPLWAGLSSPEQAFRVKDNLHHFLRLGGLQTSTRVTGEQWDAPFAWAPLQLLAVDGLERYGFHQEARDIARRFTSMAVHSFDEEGVLKEKYDAVGCTASIEEMINFGYTSNEIGFGWTNAVVLEFLDRFN